MSSPAPKGSPVIPHHRDLSGGQARAAVFGISDGLVTNVSLVLGVVGATTAPDVVRLAGLAGLIAGACSMAAGEYVSMQAQKELLERELDMERRELADHPEAERRELEALYLHRGIDPDLASRLATDVMSHPERAFEAHAREELGVDPSSLGSPLGAATASFVAFAIGALIPLLPWFFTDGRSAVALSIVGSALTCLGIGFTVGVFSGRSRTFSALRQLVLAAVAAAITFTAGSAVGMGTSI